MDIQPKDYQHVTGYTVAQEFAESVKVIHFEPCDEEVEMFCELGIPIGGVYYPDAVELEVRVKQKFYYQLSDALANQGLDLDCHPEFAEDEENVVTATYFVE